MLCDCLRVQKSYDVLPSFTAADVLRVTGVQRNSYMTLQRKVKRMGPRGKFSRIIRPLLPKEPMTIRIEYWWGVCPNLSDSMSTYGVVQKDLDVYNKIYEAYITGNPAVAGLYDRNALEDLYKA